MARVRRIALTGGFAAGKSYVRARLAARGVPTLDADALAHDAVAPGTPGLSAIAARFGPRVLGPDGALDRPALAAIVFADEGARRDLEAIVHPAVHAATDAWFAALDPARHPFAIVEIPLLYETGRDRDFDAAIVVAAAVETQVGRAVARGGMSEADARRRIAAQMPIGEKAARADFVVRTDGTHEDTDRQVEAILASLRNDPSGPNAR